MLYGQRFLLHVAWITSMPHPAASRVWFAAPTAKLDGCYHRATIYSRGDDGCKDSDVRLMCLSWATAGIVEAPPANLG